MNGAPEHLPPAKGMSPFLREPTRHLATKEGTAAMEREAMQITPGEFRVLDYDVADFVGDWTRMEYGDPQAERLLQLRQEFALDEVIAGQDSEWEMLLALKRWVRSRWDHGWSRCWSEVQDALDILRFARDGEQFTCGFYARVMRECCTALGFPARIISLGLERCEFPRDDTYWNVGHSVSEVWSNDHAKWVILDADLNVHYEWDGMPLSALEIRDLWLSGLAPEVEVVQQEPLPVLPDERTMDAVREFTGDESLNVETIGRNMRRFTRHQAMDYYARVTIGGWHYVDSRCLPTFIHHFAPASALRPTGNPADLYWSLNLVRPVLTPSWEAQSARLQVAFEHCMPYFSHVEVTVDGGAAQSCEETFQWAMRPGVNSLGFRGVNQCGRKGPIGRLSVAYANARWGL
jgi:hypothetical protein